MIKNYLVASFRNMRRNGVYAFINIFGLATGIACCLFIFYFIIDERSYDRYHEDADRIHRLAVAHQFSDGSEFLNSLTSAPMAPMLITDLPEVESTVRFTPAHQGILIASEDRQFYENRFFYADSTVFDVFSYRLLSGNPKTALVEPWTVVVTQTMADKFFGDEDPIGRILNVDGQFEYRVTGVMADVPSNSHLHFDFLASFTTLETFQQELLAHWGYNPFWTFARIRPGVAIDPLNEKIERLHEPYMEEQQAGGLSSMRLFFQPLTEIHLHPLGNEHETQGDATFVIVLFAIALFILLIACLNFINLTTARATTRSREVGLRKVVGAGRAQLIRQFLSESILYAFLATVLAFVLVLLLVPLFNVVTGKVFSIDPFLTPVAVTSIGLMILLVGIVAGFYPAVFLSNYKPVEALKNSRETSPARFRPRRVLVIAQFSISTALIVSTVIAQSQLNYLSNKKLGLNSEQVIVIPVRDEQVLNRQQTLKSELEEMPSIQSAAFMSRPPGTGAWGTSAGRLDKPDLNPFEMKYVHIDTDFIETMDITLEAGRFFSPRIASDTSGAVVLNETATKYLGWTDADEAIGQTIRYGRENEATVIGVVRDFHFQPLRVPMQALMMFPAPSAYRYLAVRIIPERVETTLRDVEEVWSRFSTWPFTYSFLDQDFANLYSAEHRLGRVMNVFSGLAVLIACLGLFGLASFSTTQRTREIGIRKVLGATVTGIVALISRSFIGLVLVSIVIASPIAYLAMSEWLANFPYRIEIGPEIFVISSAIAITIAFATISIQAIRAALADPVKSLRQE